MANTPARKKPESGKKNKTVRTAKPARAKPAKNAGRITTSAKLPSGKAKHKATVKSGKLHRGKSKGLHKAPDPQTKMRAGYGAPPPPPEPAPPLLRESKATTAALGRLEKAIKGIYQKDFKKARAELKSLIEDHTGETEILARARSYLQICIREEAAHKKPAATNDQLYGLGVMEHNIGNYEGALANFRQSLDQRPGADYIHYSIASSLAMKGDALDAIRALRRAIELNEDNRIYAKNDSDFLSLHVHKEFADLVGLTPASVGDSPE